MSTGYNDACPGRPGLNRAERRHRGVVGHQWKSVPTVVHAMGSCEWVCAECGVRRIPEPQP